MLQGPLLTAFVQWWFVSKLADAQSSFNASQIDLAIRRMLSHSRQDMQHLLTGLDQPEQWCASQLSTCTLICESAGSQVNDVDNTCNTVVPLPASPSGVKS